MTQEPHEEPHKNSRLLGEIGPAVFSLAVAGVYALLGGQGLGDGKGAG